MAINIETGKDRLSKALQYAYQERYTPRMKRKELYRLYKGCDDVPAALLNKRPGTYANLFADFVLAQQLALAWRGPRFSVEARTNAGAGFDKLMQAFINRYSEVCELPRILRQIAIDSCFGWGVAKVRMTRPAPKGVTAPVAPAVFRLDPDSFIPDITASSFDEAAYLADIYLAPLDEARESYGDDPRLVEWSMAMDHGGTGSGNVSERDAFPEAYVRLVDVYIPTTGMLHTWPVNDDRFSEVAAGEPLDSVEMPINPYEVISLMPTNDRLDEIARLEQLRELHILANDMLYKSARQARQSKRNPTAKMGDDQELDTVVSQRDGEGVLLNDAEIGLYTIPGPDPSVVSMGDRAVALFSQLGGNLSVALGQGAGAPTARQTQSLMQQISARQSIDREAFERFASNIGRKLLTLAFRDPLLELEVRERVPGTKFFYSQSWAPADRLPRIGDVCDYDFNVVPYSTAFRSPQDTVNQLQQVSGQLLQVMQVANQGAPLNLEAIMNSYAEAYDLVPQLREWWSGDPPAPPQERAAQQGQYIAQPNSQNGSTLTYVSDAGGQEQQGAPEPQQGGLSDIPQVGGIQ